MAKTIALDWDSRQLRVVIANRQGNKTEIEDVRSISLSGPGDEPTDAHSLNVKLVRALSELDLKTRGLDACVAVRRNDVELRLLNLPPVPTDELPDIVRMQALREFSELSEDWPLDFLTLHADSEATTVLSAAISPERLETYKQVLEPSEIKASVMALRPTATAVIVGKLDAVPRPVAEVCVEDLGHTFALSVLHEGTPVLIRDVQASMTNPDRVEFLADEVRRTVIAARNQLHGETAERVLMFGASKADREVGDRLAEKLKLPVRLLDPFRALTTSNRLDVQAIEQPGQYAAAIGMLAGRVDAGQPGTLIDFLNPRKTPPPKSARNTVLALTTAILLLGFLGAGGFWLHLRGLDNQVRQVQLQNQSRKKLVEASQARIDETEAVNAWMQSRINWMELLADVSIRVPAAEKARVARWQADSLSSGDGQLVVEGIVDEQSTIAQVDEALRKESRKVVNAGGSFDGREEDLPWKFKHTVTLETEAGKKAALRTARRQ